MAIRGLLDSPLTDRAMVAGVTEMETAFAAEAERIGADAAGRGVGNPAAGARPAGRPSPQGEDSQRREPEGRASP